MSLRAIELSPSADIHLALADPFKTVTLRALVHDDAGDGTPQEVSAPILEFELPTDRDGPIDGNLDDGTILITLADGAVTALSLGITHLRVLYHHVVRQVQFDWSVPVRVIVHQDIPTIWIANQRASVNAGTDNLVLSIYAQDEADVVFDICQQGFVVFSLDWNGSGQPRQGGENEHDLVDGAFAANDRELTVDHPDRFEVGDLLYIPRTGERLSVTEATGANPIHVARGVSSSAAPIADEEPIWILGGVGPTTGRVRASLGSAGLTFEVTARRSDSQFVGTKSVSVRPAFQPQPDETPDVANQREIIEELPFSSGGPAARRNILIVAEGYTAAQEGNFKRFARHLARRLQKRRIHEPFRLLRNDYRIWLAFPRNSLHSGVTVNGRVESLSGKVVDIDQADNTARLLEVKDSAFGLAYGRRAGEIPFRPHVAAEDVTLQWKTFDRESTQLLKDWRRLGSRRAFWHRESLEWLSGLWQKIPVGPPGLNIGEKWRHGGPDQGLVLFIVNDEVTAGTYTRGDPLMPNGYLFGALTISSREKFSLEQDGAKYNHSPEAGTVSNQVARLHRVLTAIHELAHGIFLGDEYENIHGLPHPVQDPLLECDNLETLEWMDRPDNGVDPNPAKWFEFRRVEKCSTLAANSVVNTPGTIEVQLQPGEGAQWSRTEDPAVALQTRNLNPSSGATFQDNENQTQLIHSRYPAFRNHPFIRTPLLSVEQVNGDTVVLNDPTNAFADHVFPPGSMLYQPLTFGGEPLSLILPGVLAHMNAHANPLHTKGGHCDQADERAVVHPNVPAATLHVVDPKKRQRLIGLYEGGGHLNCSAFRPTGECVMRVVAETVKSKIITSYVRKYRFCHICRFVIVNEINPSRHPELDVLYPGAPLP